MHFSHCGVNTFILILKEQIRCSPLHESVLWHKLSLVQLLLFPFVMDWTVALVVIVEQLTCRIFMAVVCWRRLWPRLYVPGYF